MDLVRVIAIIISGILLVLFYIIYIKSKRLEVDINFILLALLFSSLGNIGAILPNNISNRIGSIIMGIGFIFIYFHYERIARAEPNLLIISTLFMFFAASVILDLKMIFFFLTPEGKNYPLVFSPNINVLELEYNMKFSLMVSFNLYILISLIVLVQAIIIMIKINKRSPNRATIMELTGLLFLLVYRSTFGFRFIIPFEQIQVLYLIALTTAVIGIICIIATYLFHPDYLYLLPFPIHSFMIYNENGVLSYFKEVETKEYFGEVKGLLMSGAFTAIGGIVEESLGTEAKIQHINAQKFQIFFNKIGKNQGNLVVIALGNTALFKKSLKRFISTMDPPLIKKINSDFVDLDSIEPEIEHHIQVCFPYIKLKSVIPN